MTFAEKEVKKYIQNNYDKFLDMRVDQLLPLLQCLTTWDRQEIRCYTRNEGNNASVLEFFDRLWNKRGWVTQLIEALKRTKSPLADDIQKVYNDAQLPSQRRPPASSSSAVAQCPPSPPQNQSSSARDQPPKSASASTPVPSASCQDIVDSSPVQETKCPSRNNEMAIEEKVLEKDVRQKIFTPGQHSRNAGESDSSLTGQHENLTAVKVASPRSPVKHKMHLRGSSEKEMHSTKPISSRPEEDTLVQNWVSSQHRPVCVKNGYFGNMSRSVDSGLSPAPELAASSVLTPSRNQPEEDSYLSSDCSPLDPRGQDGAQDEKQIHQTSYQQQDLLDSPTNNRLPFLQRQVDEEQKGAEGQQDSISNVNTPPLLQKEEGRQNQQVSSRTVDVREMPNDGIPKSSAFGNFQRKGKTPPPSTPSETPTASSVDQASSSVCSEASHDHHLYCEPTSETPQAASSLGRSPSKTSQFSQRSSVKEHVSQITSTVPVVKFSSLPSDFTGSSSTDVIPPSSPAAVSAILSDGYTEDLKCPVQERELVGTSPWTISNQMTGDMSLRATVAWSSAVTDTSTNSREKRNNAGGPSRGASVFHSNQENEDVFQNKPGVLVSEEIVQGPLDQPLSNDGREYSGTLGRLRISGEYPEESEPLMLSSSTQNSHSEDSRRNVLMGTNNTSLHLQNDNHSNEGSIKTHTVCVQEPPSVDLTGVPEVTRPALGNASQSTDDVLDSVTRDQSIKNAGSHPICGDGQRNSHPNESDNSGSSLHPSGSTLLALGFALASLVAFVVYKQLKK